MNKIRPSLVFNLPVYERLLSSVDDATVLHFLAAFREACAHGILECWHRILKALPKANERTETLPPNVRRSSSSGEWLGATLTNLGGGRHSSMLSSFNGGLNGFQDRQRYLALAQERLA